MTASSRRWQANWLVVVLATASLALAGRPGLAALPARASMDGYPNLTADDAPVPIAFPGDDGPHAAPIEWWYYTGHLETETGDRYGFQLVAFKGERAGLTAYAAHFAITDNRRGEFRYAEQLVPGVAVSTPVPGGGFDLRLGDWRMSGANGDDRLVAAMPDYAISLRLTSVKPPVLHGGDGYIRYGGEQATYYYSRTRLEVAGSLVADGASRQVAGLAWMDHQWGAFTTFADGGWDWYAVQLEDGWDLMLYTILAPDGTPELAHGSVVAPDGTVTLLEEEDFEATASGSWRSAATVATYPSGWDVAVPAADLGLTLTPVLVDQEIDAAASTGQIYWEGEVVAVGTRAGRPVNGWGYVELTGYAARTPDVAQSATG